MTVKGPKGEMTQAVNPDINVTLEDGIIHLTRPTDEKEPSCAARFVSFAD